MTNTEHNKIEQTCNESFEIYLSESKQKHRKYKYLPDWLLYKAKKLRDERIQNSSKFKIYDRGSLVMISFGVNIGQEMSGNHFGIVLTKKDNPYSGNLTVIPISSKSNRYYLDIGNLILDQSISFLEKKQHKITVKISLLSQYILDNYSDEIDSDFNELLVENVTLSKQVLDIAAKQNEEYEKYIRNLIEEEKSNLITQKLNFRKIVGMFKVIRDEREAFNKVKNTYKRYDKVSYACYRQIQTISKNRIVKINQYDPSGKIKVSPNSLRKIDGKIVETFTNIRIDT